MRILFTSLCLLLLLFSTMVSAKIVFTSTRDGTRGIYVMDDDSSNVTLLTDILSPSRPRWSPDGKQIVFTRNINAGNSQNKHMLLMNADGTNIRQLTEPSNNKWSGHASFLPDGKSILFKQTERIDNEDRFSVNIMDLDRSKIKQISDLGANFPDISPDGRHIVFGSFAAAGGDGGNLYIMLADGGNPRELLLPPLGPEIVHRSVPRWSPDGKQIVYKESKYNWVEVEDPVKGGKVLALAYSEFRIIICDQNGTTIRKLNIPKNWASLSPIWVDNGTSLIFSAHEVALNVPFKSGFYNIYKYHIQTGKITRLSEHPGNDYSLDWISDKTYSVTPQGKKKVQWGTLKQ